MEIALVAPGEQPLGRNELVREELAADAGGRLASAFGRQPRENLGLGLIAARLRLDGHSVQIFDLQHGASDLLQVGDEIERGAPDLVGISVLYDLQLYPALQLARRLRAAGYGGQITAGGPFATLAAPYLLAAAPALDSVVLGEGVETAAELLRALQQGGDAWRGVAGLAHARERTVLTTGPRPAADLSALPFAARDTLSGLRRRGRPAPTAAMFASVGCRGRCSFCSAPALADASGGERWRARGGASVVQEMEQVARQLELSHFYFCDDNFAGHGRRAARRLERLARRILERGLQVDFRVELRADACGDSGLLELLREAGLSELLLGLESGSQGMLRRLGKQTPPRVGARAWHNARALGLAVEPSMILVDAHSSVSELQRTVQFIADHRLYDTHQPLHLFNQLVVFPGTPVEQQMAAEGLITLPDPWQLPDDLATDEGLLRHCRRVAHRRYRIVDPVVRRAWRALAAAANSLAEFDGRRVPAMLERTRRQVMAARGAERERQRRHQQLLLAQVRRWRQGLPELVMLLLQTTADWCGSARPQAADAGALGQTLTAAVGRLRDRCFAKDHPW